MKKFGLRLMVCWKCYFLIFAFFIFPNFKWLLPKILWKNHSFLKWILRVLIKYYYVRNTFDLQNFNNWNFHEKAFVSLFYPKWKKHYNLTFNVHLKCTVLHYANVNSSSIDKPYLQAVEYTILFFCLFVCLFFTISYLCLF